MVLDITGNTRLRTDGKDKELMIQCHCDQRKLKELKGVVKGWGPENL